MPPSAPTPSHFPPKGNNPARAAIEDYIRRNQLKPGDMLPSESALVAQLGVSRSSVREAMRTLASLDVVTIRHGHGTYVSTMSLAPLVNGMILRMTLNESETLTNLEYVVETRQALDLAVGDDLIAHMNKETADRLAAIIEDMRDRHARGETFRDQDYAFHDVLHSLVGNQLIKELSIALWEVHTQVLATLNLPTPEDMGDTVDAHQDMLTALTSGNVELYQDMVRKHYAPLKAVIRAHKRS